MTLTGVVPLNKELGRGAYGRVYAVKFNGLVCAAKELHSIFLTELVEPEQKQALKDCFLRECCCGCTIRHPNIVTFLGVYYPSNQYFFPVMVMELMATSLTKFMESNKSNIHFDRKLAILYDVTLGLSYLHNHKPVILHRDLSSNNVLLTSEQVAKIGDLGMAKLKDNKQMRSTLTKMPGTLDFMPPEVTEENPVYSTPIDVFSFGAVALHVFSEEWPKPSAQTYKDPISRRWIAISEVARRQCYFDMMTGKAIQLRTVLEQCLDDFPDERPPILEVSAIIERLKVRISTSNSVYSYLCTYVCSYSQGDHVIETFVHCNNNQIIHFS